MERRREWEGKGKRVEGCIHTHIHTVGLPYPWVPHWWIQLMQMERSVIVASVLNTYRLFFLVLIP